ncbi:MAG: GAF domain-containing sensor histidine kinase [Caldilineaceae bacterium]|nr:GAF domain-containing sensor histidine kinase [Caldilineaceae bacterium]
MTTTQSAGLSSVQVGPIRQRLHPAHRRWLAGIFLLLTATAGAFMLWLAAQGCGEYLGVSPFMAAVNVAGSLAFAVLSVFILLYRSGNRIGWLCGWIALGMIVSVTAFTGMTCGVGVSPPIPGLPIIAWTLYSFSAFFLILPLFILLPLLFPTGHFLSVKWAWATGIGVLLLFLTAVATSVAPDLRQDNAYGYFIDLDNPFGRANLPTWWRPTVRSAKLLVTCLLCFMAIASMIVRLRRSRGDERQQVKWLAYFVATAVAFQILVFELPGGLFYPEIFHTIWYDLIIGVVVIGFPTTIGIALFKYRLYDIDILINRTLVYGALTMIVATIYVVIVAGSGRLFHNENNLIASLAATGVIAVLFHPLRSRLQGSIKRWLYGERDDPAGVLTRLTSQLETTGSSGSLLAVLVETIASSLKLPYVAIWLYTDDGALTLVTQTGVQRTEVDTLPLLHQQETVGQLQVAPRAPGEALSAEDRQLLAAIARLTAATARTIQLTDQVQEARVRTVSAREEERRRLRRDLHDGLGPVLASQGLKLAAARQLLRERPEVAERLLDEVMTQSENTVAEVRRLVYALRPPTLDELGLVEAIREHVQVVGTNAGVRITLDAPPNLPEIPAAIEVAAFRVVQEALNNVIRHAGARHCAISIAAESGLHIRIEDDGIGLPAETRSGVGLQSMRERAVEVGGVCSIENGDERGVVVQLSLPIQLI